MNKQLAGFLVFRGSSLLDGTVYFEPVDFVQNDPFIGHLFFKEIKFVGKSKDGSVIFIRHPYERVNPERVHEEVAPHHFAIALEIMPRLQSITVLQNEKEIKTFDRSEKAVIDFQAETILKDDGVELTVHGTYHRLTVIVRGPESDVWNHIFQDISPTEEASKTIKIPWEQFPVAKHAVVEAFAVRGIDVASSCTKSIEVSIQPAKILIFPVGFHETKTDDGVVYQFAFGAKGELHGQLLPDSAFQWFVLGKAHKGRYVSITQKRKVKFKIKLVATDPKGRKFSSKINLDPRIWSKKRGKRVIQCLNAKTNNVNNTESKAH